jgi:hypothetical protein
LRIGPRSPPPLAAYKNIYEIEASAADATDDERLRLRQSESQPVWDELRAWCEANLKHEPPSSKLGEAVRYFTNHSEALGRFLTNGAIPIDNGIVERLHVRAALSRKNYLFAGSDAGGERAAIAYTILACCRLSGVNPVEYPGRRAASAFASRPPERGPRPRPRRLAGRPHGPGRPGALTLRPRRSPRRARVKPTGLPAWGAV